MEIMRLTATKDIEREMDGLQEEENGTNIS